MCVYLARSSTNFNASESPQIVERYNEKAQDMVDIEKAYKSRLLSRDFVQRDRLKCRSKNLWVGDRVSHKLDR